MHIIEDCVVVSFFVVIFVIIELLSCSLMDVQLQGQSCKIGNAPNSGAKKSKFMFCPFWMHSWYCLMSTLMEKIICKLKYCMDIFFGGNSSILCPAETLQISRLSGVPACVSTSQPNKTSHNQWNKHIFGEKKILLDIH